MSSLVKHLNITSCRKEWEAHSMYAYMPLQHSILTLCSLPIVQVFYKNISVIRFFPFCMILNALHLTHWSYLTILLITTFTSVSLAPVSPWLEFTGVLRHLTYGWRVGWKEVNGGTHVKPVFMVEISVTLYCSCQTLSLLPSLSHIFG